MTAPGPVPHLSGAKTGTASDLEWPATPAVVAETLDGGQCFRWNRGADGVWRGVSGAIAAEVHATSVGTTARVVAGTAEDLRWHLATDLDWPALIDRLPWRTDAHLARCLAAYPGLRILRQPFGETLLCFLCSATKQIVQIKQMVELLAVRFGNPLPDSRAPFLSPAPECPTLPSPSPALAPAPLLSPSPSPLALPSASPLALPSALALALPLSSPSALPSPSQPALALPSHSPLPSSSPPGATVLTDAGPNGQCTLIEYTRRSSLAARAPTQCISLGYTEPGLGPPVKCSPIGYTELGAFTGAAAAGMSAVSGVAAETPVNPGDAGAAAAPANAVEVGAGIAAGTEVEVGDGTAAEPEVTARTAMEAGKEVGAVHAIHALPTWAALAEVDESELRACKLGFRARHVFAVARKLAEQPGWLAETAALPYAKAKARLITLPGVGEKIADCVLLFGAGRLEAFPVDVWVLRALARRYGLDGWAPAQVAQFGRAHFGPLAGLAQQFLFVWERRHGNEADYGREP